MSASALYRVLPGLPGEGPIPLQFSTSGQGTHREGFVVEFFPESTARWVGNFQPGLTSLYTVITQQEGRPIVVVAGGQGYVVDAKAGALQAQFGGGIEWLQVVPKLDGLLVSNGIAFSLRRGPEVVWQSQRLSWDGMRDLSIEGVVLKGQGWCFDDTWHSFEVNLVTGVSTGGAYHGPEP